MLSLLLSGMAFAAACNPSAQELKAWSQKAKIGVVFESMKGMRTSAMDEAEIKEAAKSNACLSDALKLASERAWFADPALQDAFKYLYCERISALAFVPNVHHRNGATAFVRTNLSHEEGSREISIGGKYEQGSCRELLLKQIRENTLATMQAVIARPRQAATPLPALIKAVAKVPVSPPVTRGVREEGRGQKASLTGGTGGAEIPGTVRGAD